MKHKKRVSYGTVPVRAEDVRGQLMALRAERRARAVRNGLLFAAALVAVAVGAYFAS